MNQTELEKEALRYLTHGFSVIPVRDSKQPLLSAWREFQQRRATAEEVKGWFATYPKIDGIAIVTGEVSNLIVLDVEVDGDTKGLDIPDTVVTKTGGGGRHYYFRHPGYPVKNLVRIDGRKIDLRGDGGYVVAPPSQTTKGIYEWVSNLDVEMAEMPEWLEEKEDEAKPVSNLNEWSSMFRGVEEGSRHDTAVRITGKLLAHIPPKDRDSIIPPLLLAWNKQNKPELPVKELEQVYLSIRDRQEQKDPPLKAPAKERNPLTVTELLAYLPKTEPFLVDALVPHRGITALGGQPGVGKSWIMLEIAKAVARGEPLFGRFSTLQGNVLIVDEESGMDEMWRRAKMLSYSDDLPIFFHIVAGFKLDKESDLEHLVATIRKENISLVILDPYIGLHSKSENSAEETAVVMEAMQKLVEAGAAVLYIHHLRKDSIVKYGLAQALRGSSVLLGRLDSLIVAKNTGGGEGSTEIQIHHEKARRGRKLPPFQLTLTEEEGRISVGNLSNIEPARLKAEQARSAILDVLADGEEHSRQELLEAIKTAAGVGAKNTSDALRVLAEDKVVVEKRNGREKCYQLPPKDSGSEVIDI